MPKWWPWGRSTHPDPTPAAAVAQREPAWQRLAPLQRTLGDLQTTAHLQGFSTSLTTSQNPAVTGPLDLLSADHVDQLPVLGTVPHPSDTAPASPAPTPRSRAWGP